MTTFYVYLSIKDRYIEQILKSCKNTIKNVTLFWVWYYFFKNLKRIFFRSITMVKKLAKNYCNTIKQNFFFFFLMWLSWQCKSNLKSYLRSSIYFKQNKVKCEWNVTWTFIWGSTKESETASSKKGWKWSGILKGKRKWAGMRVNMCSSVLCPSSALLVWHCPWPLTSVSAVIFPLGRCCCVWS